jgi:KTSC domain
MVEMKPVVSDPIEEVGYEAGELFVRFRHSGKTYVYYVVPESVFRQFMVADSLGRFLNEEIKPNYRCREV